MLMEANMRGRPTARTSTPIIGTIVVRRKTQLSVSYAEANQEELTRARQRPKLAKAKPIRAVA